MLVHPVTRAVRFVCVLSVEFVAVSSAASRMHVRHMVCLVGERGVYRTLVGCSGVVGRSTSTPASIRRVVAAFIVVTQGRLCGLQSARASEPLICSHPSPTLKLRHLRFHTNEPRDDWPKQTVHAVTVQRLRQRAAQLPPATSKSCCSPTTVRSKPSLGTTSSGGSATSLGAAQELDDFSRCPARLGLRQVVTCSSTRSAQTRKPHTAVEAKGRRDALLSCSSMPLPALRWSIIGPPAPAPLMKTVLML